jgi:elongation factor P
VATTNDIKNGSVLNLDGGLWSVVEFQHDKTFNAGTKVDFETVDRRNMQYLYHDGQDFVFMDPDNFDQLTIPAAVVGEAKDYMLENSTVMVATHDGTPLFIELPASVVLEITYTEPGLQGDRATGGTKLATLETGREIQVPLFLEIGTRVKVDTRSGDYISRVND